MEFLRHNGHLRVCLVWWSSERASSNVSCSKIVRTGIILVCLIRWSFERGTDMCHFHSVLWLSEHISFYVRTRTTITIKGLNCVFGFFSPLFFPSYMNFLFSHLGFSPKSLGIALRILPKANLTPGTSFLVFDHRFHRLVIGTPTNPRFAWSLVDILGIFA